MAPLHPGTTAGSYASTQNTPQTFPNCDIYYNNNKSFDRQLAGFGEVSYNVHRAVETHRGGRYAKMSFDLTHHGDGFENFGPDDATGTYHENAFTPKLGVSFQLDPENLFYATYAKGFRPGGVNAPLAGICAPYLVDLGYTSGQSPLNYNPTPPRASKSDQKRHCRSAANRHEPLLHQVERHPAERIRGRCGLQFTDNLGTAVAWGGDVQGELVLGGGFSLEAAVGYTSARFHEGLAGRTGNQGRRDLRRGGDQLRARHESALDCDRRPAIQLQGDGTRCLRPAGLGIHQPQPVARAGPGS